MFNPIIGKNIDWDRLNEPITERPIPMCYYGVRHIRYAIRHPNKALTICRGDCLFALPRPKWSVVE